jgi:hypothetical protein
MRGVSPAGITSTVAASITRNATNTDTPIAPPITPTQHAVVNAWCLGRDELCWHPVRNYYRDFTAQNFSLARWRFVLHISRMKRITRKDLNQLMAIVAERLHRPAQAYRREHDGKLTANVGALLLTHAGVYGGWDLVEIDNDGGGQHSLIGNTFGGRGRLKAHEMESFMLGMLAGLDRLPQRKAGAA